MLAYIYNADMYCQDCGEKIKAELTKEGKAPEAPEDEYTFDSDDFPKGPYGNGGGEADYPKHCGACQVFLENPLTGDGWDYVVEAVIERRNGANNAVLDLWADFYGVTVND